MIYIENTLDDWLTKHPALKQGVSTLMCLCGRVPSADSLKPWRSHEFVGVTTKCTHCKRELSSGIALTSENRRILNLAIASLKKL